MKEQLESRLAHLRPILASAGRSIEVLEIDAPKVTFKVSGFCSECACSSSYKDGLKELVEDVCPQLTDVCFVE